MKTAAIILDDWKLAIFKRHLDKAGFKYTEHPGVTAKTLLLKVSYEWTADLAPVVAAANNEAARSKMQ